MVDASPQTAMLAITNYLLSSDAPRGSSARPSALLGRALSGGRMVLGAEGMPPADALRVVIFSNAPRQGFALHLEILSSLGHTLAGVVTTPGPARRRSQTYLDVIQLTPPTTDIIVTAHPK